jgi:hypothetical protein
LADPIRIGFRIELWTREIDRDDAVAWLCHAAFRRGVRDGLRADPVVVHAPRSRARPTRSSSTTGSAASPGRGYVQQGRFAEVDGVAEIAKSIKLGDGMEPDTQMGPLVPDEQLRRVTSYVDSGLAEGATARAGGGRHGGSGYFVEPTVLTNTHPGMAGVRQEISGPG